MLDFTSKKFIGLSKEAKILILYSNAIEKTIVWSKVFAESVGLNYPDDEILFIRLLQEIEAKKIDYKIEKIKFKAPSTQECEFFLQIVKNRLKKSLTLSEIKHFSIRFHDYYEKKNWKKNGIKISDWKQELIYAANNWNDNFVHKDQKQSSSSYNLDDELEKAFGGNH